MVDVQRDGFPAAKELITAAVNWYQSHFAYQHSLQAGARRIDLDGNEVGTVTERENSNAQKKIKEDKQRVNGRNLSDPARTLAALCAARRIPDDQLRKVDAPTRPKAAAATAPAPSTADAAKTNIETRLVSFGTAMPDFWCERALPSWGGRRSPQRR